MAMKRNVGPQYSIGSDGRGEVIEVVRNMRQAWFGIIVAIVVLALGLDGVIENRSISTMTDQVSFYVLMAISAWIAWRITACTRLVIYDGGILAVNWVRVYWIPWAAVASIHAGEELRIVLTDGREVRPAVGAASLGGALHGSPRQRTIRQKIDELRSNPASNAYSVDGETPVVKLYFGFRYGLPVICLGIAVVIIVTLLRHS